MIIAICLGAALGAGAGLTWVAIESPKVSTALAAVTGSTLLAGAFIGGLVGITIAENCPSGEVNIQIDGKYQCLPTEVALELLK